MKKQDTKEFIIVVGGMLLAFFLIMNLAMWLFAGVSPIQVWLK